MAEVRADQLRAGMVVDLWHWHIGDEPREFVTIEEIEVRDDGVLMFFVEHPAGTSYPRDERMWVVGEREAAEQAFLDASVAVWREIDAAMARGPYKGIDVTEEGQQLRLAEREAWDRYRRALDGE